MTYDLGSYANENDYDLGSYNFIEGRNQWLPNGNSYITAGNTFDMTGLVTTITLKDLLIDTNDTFSQVALLYQGTTSVGDLGIRYFSSGILRLNYKNVSHFLLLGPAITDQWPDGIITGELTVVANETLETWELYSDSVLINSGVLTLSPGYVQSGRNVFIGAQPNSDDIGETDAFPSTATKAQPGWRIGNIDVVVDGSQVIDLVMPTGVTTNVPDIAGGNDGTLRLGTGDGSDWAVVPNTEKPVITLLGITPVDHTINTPYIDAGATADDQKDGDITSSIITTSDVNTGVSGAYSVAYNVTNSDGIDADEVTRVVNVSGVESIDFNNVFGASLSTLTESNLVSLTGSGGPFTITVTGGEYQVNGGSYTSAAGLVNIGDAIRQRITSSPSYSTPVLSSITVGGVVGNFYVTTTFDPALTASGESRLAIRLGLGL